MPPKSIKIPLIPSWSSQRATISSPLEVSGRGLHTGCRCHVKIKPAPAYTGVVFQRIFPDKPSVNLPASIEHVFYRPLCTSLRANNETLFITVEHLLAALRACQIDDVFIEMNAEEVPIFDGTALPWIELIQSVSRLPLNAPRQYIQIIKPLEWKNRTHFLRLEPYSKPAFYIDVSIDEKSAGIWSWKGELTPDIFINDIAAARSYGRLSHALPAYIYSWYKGIPLLRGASLSTSAVIVGKYVIGGKRMPDEFVKHKIIDMLGDFSLLGYPLLGHLKAIHPTHNDNAGLMKMFLKNKAHWRLVEADGCV